MFRRREYDLIVIGGGPGGCATAAIAARRGLDVLLLERSPQSCFKVGESLMPETYWTFEKMGVLDRLRRSAFPVKHSVQFFPRSGKASAPFYFSTLNDHESSRTWQVPRAEFDQLLFDGAAEQGAECWRGVSAREVSFDGERAVGVRVEGPGFGPIELGAKVVADATGQSTLIGKRLGLERVDYGLKHASIFTHFRGARRDTGIDEGATLILHTRDGDSWFWFIPLPEDVVSIGVVGGVDYLVQQRRGTPQDTFFEEVEKCGEIASRIAGAHQVRPMAVLRDFSYRYDRTAGDGWVLIGDAFSFVDPVYSSGVYLALKSGEMAAEAIVDALAADDVSGERLGRFEPQLRAGIEAVYGLVRAFYTRDFSFGAFLRKYPEMQRDITRILVGDVLDGGFTPLFEAMRQFQGEQADTRMPAEQLAPA